MTLAKLDRAQIFPEKSLPDAAALIAEGRKMAETVKVGRSPFLEKHGVASESAYKLAATLSGVPTSWTPPPQSSAHDG